jgi:uncharacterized membrane protein YdjX (TVP38/TMEM64 family)
MRIRLEKVKAGFYLFAVAALFIAITYLAQKSLSHASLSSDNIPVAIAIYIFILVIEAVFAPINTMPLIPLAAALFGWLPAAIYTLAGWTIGALAVFMISQKYGKALIGKIVPMEKLARYERIIPTNHLFLNIILLRIFLPLDIVSYLLGIFTNVKKEIYIIATAIGYAPLAFLIAYVGTLPAEYLIFGSLFLVAVIMVDIAILKKRFDKI